MVHQLHIDLRFNLYDTPSQDIWLYIIYSWFRFFFSIDRFDLICLIIRLKFYSDEFLHFTYGFEFNLYTKDMKKINMFKIML